jgi:hypothetical protein
MQTVVIQRPEADSPVATLPLPVRRYFERSLPSGSAVPRQLRIGQEGQMWLKPGSRAMRFTATEVFAVDRIAFSWQARFPLFGPLAMKVVDGYADGDGELAVRLLGLPIQRQRGPETSIGEALRYLAELPWVPHAIGHNSGLEWRQLDERSVEVATHLGPERLRVLTEFDTRGDIVRTAATRPRLDGKTWVPTPWAGEFGDYKVLSGIRLPTSAEVYWELPAGRYVYWRGRVTSAEPLDTPFTEAGRSGPRDPGRR